MISGGGSKNLLIRLNSLDIGSETWRRSPTFSMAYSEKVETLLLFSLADGEYLTSGNPKNGTELKCFEQSVLIFNRMFVGQDHQNYITFRYKVDGAPCRRGSKNCNYGLSVSVNRKRVFQNDVQYQWVVKNISVQQVRHYLGLSPKFCFKY